MKRALGLIIKHERQGQNMSQQALCEGICSVSYLSKIESGQTEASEDIIKHLLMNLDCLYVDNMDVIQNYMELIDSSWDLFLNTDEYDLELLNALNDSSQSMIYSKVCIDALIARAFCALQMDLESYELVFMLEPYAQLMNELQRYRYEILKSNYWLAYDCKGLIDSHFQDMYGWVDLNKMNAFFLEGLYTEALELSEKTYMNFAYQGNVRGMMFVAELAGSCHANLGNLSLQLGEIRKVRRLNRYVQRKHTEYQSEYNLGSSYLVSGMFDEALIHLNNARSLMEAFEALNSSTYQKLAFTHVFLGNYTMATEYLERIETENPVTLKSIDLIQYMISNHDYIHEKRYIELLESCYNESLKHNHSGIVQFYGTYLLEAYKKNYQYQKALKMTESLVFHR